MEIPIYFGRVVRDGGLLADKHRWQVIDITSVVENWEGYTACIGFAKVSDDGALSIVTTIDVDIFGTEPGNVIASAC